ncbi:SMC-Scp complex subunit ScpB [Mycoplasmoides pneumoniae]|uniref:Segregation and condensation protein B n=4 Tax=Mycoplasmoides pneumoniae TaxID=2104 RepID=SCPB_MYCPN|nr:SMC-Scp complex subunit ScpB [Mycoplasmoides pneumoniae]P75477.1 RecName: Full=Segregation and condensation protein B [Mycoplasmoides pneumoniae M129]AAB96183.1 conserved hypothetical protein [Mycoplasmoides pneumoniae M129]ADK86684.1 segregation and condensation protein B [Mycoplasmoides pneumoniae FH]AGC04223.1 saccharide deacetylase [Mycoplasmoides pneumoniae M129-B7]ALA30184.1 saccharide deacetylase [Mycoplasmoides pneumoniae PI 1428]ALA31136.1 saccharide deacetylase [Mycoplasmoides pn
MDATIKVTKPVLKQKDSSAANLVAAIYGLLFVSGEKGLTLAELNRVLRKVGLEKIKAALVQLERKLSLDDESGIEIKKFGHSFRLVTKMEIKDFIHRYLPNKIKNPLNSKTMEVLAIIAYNQPCTRPRINEIRGADSFQIVDDLLEKELIVELGRKDTPGRPFIYEVSPKFYDLFGINSLDELPKVENFDLDKFRQGSFFDSNRYGDD